MIQYPNGLPDVGSDTSAKITVNRTQARMNAPKATRNGTNAFMAMRQAGSGTSTGDRRWPDLCARLSPTGTIRPDLGSME